MSPFGLVVHGGAGLIRRSEMAPELVQGYLDGLTHALDAGHAALSASGSAVDAVVIALELMEDCPLFNAGIGASINADGVCELDASIMDGRNEAAGAVAAVRTVRHPIALARDVMQRSPHVLMIGSGAEDFAVTMGHARLDNSVFQTARSLRQWRILRELEAAGHSPDAIDWEARLESLPLTPGEEKLGTVGCVALDRHGHLAAGTSTGGMLNKRFGRVGDSPLIGAGTYARDGICAVSATGHGEYFIRAGAAHDLAARIAYRGDALVKAAADAIANVGRLGGSGGLIAIDAQGNIALPFNTAGMYAAYRTSSREARVDIFSAPSP